MSEHHRITSTMSSRKLLALDFIKRYFARWGYPPSLSEVAAELQVSVKRAHDLVRQLADAKMIEHIAGQARGIRLIDRGEEIAEADLLVRLSSMGWTVAHNGAVIQAPGAPPLTEKGLPRFAELDHDPDLTSTRPGTHAPDPS